MERKKTSDWFGLIRGLWKSVVFTAAFYTAGILIFSGLIHAGLIPWTFRSMLLYALSALAAFGAAAVSTLFIRHQRMPKGILSQVFFLAVLLLTGMLAFEAQTNWLSLGITALVMLLSAVLAILLFGGGKKKKFKKNATIRLKKR